MRPSAQGPSIDTSVPRQQVSRPAPTLPPLTMPQEYSDGGTHVGTGSVKVALLVPLSGRHADLGNALLNASQIALFDTNIARLTLLPLDTEGTPAGAQAAMQQAIDKGAHLVLGPVFADSIRAVKANAGRNNIPIIGFSTDRSVAGNGVYIMGFTPEQQIDRIVDHAAGQGHTRFAALIPETLFGERMLSAYTAAISRRYGELVQVEMYPNDDNALFDPVKRLANYDIRRTALLEEVAAMEAFGEDDDLAGDILKTMENVETLGELTFDAVLLPAGGRTIRSLAPLLPYYEIDPALIQFLGTGMWDDPGLRLEPALHGARFAGPVPEAAAGFAERYQATYDHVPPRIASLAYDATALAATLIRLNGSRPFSKTALSNRRGFAGVDGVFRFQPDGTAERRLTIIEISPVGLQVVEEALTTASPTQLTSPPAAELEQEPSIEPAISSEEPSSLHLEP